MNAYRVIATIVSTTALAAAAGVASAQAPIHQRIDEGGASSQTAEAAVVRGVVVEGDNIRISSLVGRASADARTTTRNVHLWSVAADGTLELRVNGVIHRHGNNLLL